MTEYLEPFSSDWLRSTGTLALVPFEYKYRDEMENRRAYVVIFYFVYIFSFEIRFSLKPVCQTKRHDQFTFTHPPT